jgi:hypothetical protein
MVLGDAEFDRCVASGAAMEFAEAVEYARQQISCTREALVTVEPAPVVVIQLRLAAPCPTE